MKSTYSAHFNGLYKQLTSRILPAILDSMSVLVSKFGISHVPVQLQHKNHWNLHSPTGILH